MKKFKIILMNTLFLTSLFSFDQEESFQIEMFLGQGTGDQSGATIHGHAGMTFSILSPFDEDNALLFSYGMTTSNVSQSSLTSRSINDNFIELQYVREFSDHRFGLGVSYHGQVDWLDENTTVDPTTQFSESIAYVASYTYMIRDEKASFWHPFLVPFFLSFIGFRYEYLNFTETSASTVYDASSLSLTMGWVF